MEEKYDFKCAKCGNETYLVADNQYEKVLICKECAKCLTIEIKKLRPNEISCPYCHSTDTKKISGLSKAASIALVGIFALDQVGKQWHCNDCKSDF